MDLTRTEEQAELAESARQLLHRHGLDWWPRAAAAGWSSLAVPEHRGGAGASRSDLAVLFEELGRAAVDAPVLDRLVLGPELLMLLQPEGLADFVAGINSGATGIAVHVDDPVRIAIDRSRVRGRVRFARHLDGITHHLLITADAWALVASTAATIEPVHGFLPDAVSVSFDGATLAAGPLDSAARGDVDACIVRALPLLCAYQVGSCQAVYELSLSYARERVQFGKAIGTFQRVQDHVIDIVNAADSARWATNYAVWRSEGNGTALEQAVAAHVAKAVAAESHVAACTSAHEVHAGIGADVQYPLARYTYASRALHARFGDPRAHRRRLGVLLGLATS